MAPLSKHLSGFLLPVATFGTHLDSSGKTINRELERQNFEAAAELLCDVWSEMIINGHQVFAQCIEEDAAELPPLLGEHWLIEHRRQSRYTLQIRKCGSVTDVQNFQISYHHFSLHYPIDLADRLALSSCFSEPICLDQYCPTMKDNIKRKNAHEKACQEFEMDFMNFQDPEETVIEDEVDLAEKMRQVRALQENYQELEMENLKYEP
uniref:Uncharacterized protein n=1 Tax=Ditylenchus dipsaci TaxID=166011 RepID=A0A915DY87_9BILA